MMIVIHSICCVVRPKPRDLLARYIKTGRVGIYENAFLYPHHRQQNSLTVAVFSPDEAIASIRQGGGRGSFLLPDRLRHALPLGTKSNRIQPAPQTIHNRDTLGRLSHAATLRRHVTTTTRRSLDLPVVYTQRGTTLAVSSSCLKTSCQVFHRWTGLTRTRR